VEKPGEEEIGHLLNQRPQSDIEPNPLNLWFNNLQPLILRFRKNAQRPSAAGMRWRGAFYVSGRSGPIAKFLPFLPKIAIFTGRGRKIQ
jgi:hypothetical protein